ncbi:metal ABC transporter solute-binding protein, Zn/Mn family [Paracoccus sp. (in: a-proteobacteria)]|uniref:zinc ABC transporter substrate-binding protein n=1 Tax=Paracoccus sp. TaxID=267 RepID=UPI002899D22A|nr:zinc ABC transporter substrate-binding protein [Paracoccus sp. (in: a-proteobacteria)]
MTHFCLPQISVALMALAATTLGAPLAQAAPPNVVTDIPIVSSLVSEVMGDLAQPQALLPSGGDPHDYQLRPSQARAVEAADLLIWVGPSLTPWMARARENLAVGKASVELLSLPGTKLRDFGPGGEHQSAEHDQAKPDGEHEHDHDHDHDHEGHSHSGVDPHAWLDPDNAKIWLKGIAEDLATADPEHRGDYYRNAGQAAARIGQLEGQISAQLAPAQGKSFIVMHDAYGYFTSRFGLAPAIAISHGDAQAPSAARLREIKTDLAASGAVCAFAEQNHDARLIDAAIEGSGIRLGQPLDPEGTALPPGPELYRETLGKLAQNIADCLNQ